MLCRSRRGPFASYYDAVVVESRDVAGSGERDGFGWAAGGGHLVVSRASSADHAAADLDSLAERALAVADAAQTSTSSTSPSGS